MQGLTSQGSPERQTMTPEANAFGTAASNCNKISNRIEEVM
jgi:hypothetical protein